MSGEDDGMSPAAMTGVGFPPEHAFRHTMGPDGRESLAHMLMFPELGVAGFIYPTVRADGHAKGRASLFGPALLEPVHEQVEQVVPDAMNFDDWHTGPLRMRVIEPHLRVDIAWEGERINFLGHYEAMHPVFAFSMHPLGNPRYYGDDRTEQHGRVAGRLIAPGIDEQVQGFMIRDHSWGPRIWGLNQHYKWFHAVTAASSIHFFEMDSFGRRQVRGYLYRDGVLGNIRSVEYDVEYDDQMLHRRLRCAVVDTEGRTAHVDAVTFASVPMEFDPMVYNSEAAVTVDIDGVPGTGWSEFCWNRNYLDYARKYVTVYG